MKFFALIREHATVVLEFMPRFHKSKSSEAILCSNAAGITHCLWPAVNLLKRSDRHRAATAKEPVRSAINRLIVLTSRPAMVVTGAMVHELKHFSGTGNFKVGNLPECTADYVTFSHRLTHGSEPSRSENGYVIHVSDPIVLGVT